MALHSLKTLTVAPGRKLVNYTFAQFYVWKKHTVMYTKKTEWFSKIVSKIIILYIYICISKHVKWKFPLFYENSAGSLQVCRYFWEKKSTSTTSLFHPTSVTAKLLRCIRISFPSLDKRQRLFWGFVTGLPTWAARFATCFLLSCYFWGCLFFCFGN